MTRFAFISILLVFCLAACSDNNHDSATTKDSGKTIIDPQIQALEKAKSVEKQLLDAADKQRNYIESQGDH
tara:strand:- start:2074 stop:2286 length:213 start_codon:yes stop_codon:yes gene_type:complete